MYTYTADQPGVTDCWDFPQDFIDEMKDQHRHPNVLVTHNGGDSYTYSSENIVSLYRIILEGCGDDEELALQILHGSVKYLALPVKTPVSDDWCNCDTQLKHRLSMHGTAPEWDAKHYWVVRS